MVELGLPSTSDPPTSFYSSEFSSIVKLTVIATTTGMLTGTVTEIGTVKQDALCFKKILVVSATVFNQPCPTILSNPWQLTTKCLLPKISPKAADSAQPELKILKFLPPTWLNGSAPLNTGSDHVLQDLI
jgi:hypothetical protein